MAEIVFEKVGKSFGSTKVIENLDLTIEDGKSLKTASLPCWWAPPAAARPRCCA